MVREEGGKVTGAWFIGGTQFAGANWSLQAPVAEFSGEIAGATRTLDGAPDNAFTTTAELPPGEALRDAWLTVTLPNGQQQGFQVSRVEQRDGQTVIVLADDPGLKIAGETVQEVYFPGRNLQGRCRFRLPTLVSVLRANGDVHQKAGTSTAEVSLPK